MGTATDSRVIRKYRLPTAQLVLITLLLGLPGVPLAHSIVPEDNLPVVFRAGMLVLMGVVYLFIVWLWRAATIVHQDHLTVRQLFRTRRTAWSDVLRIETEPASSRTMVLDRAGRLFALPGGVAAQDDAVRTIQDVWERSRGEGWTPPAEAMVVAARHRTRAHEYACVWAMLLAAGALLAVFAAGFVQESNAAWDEEMPLFLQVAGFVPLVVFGAGYHVAVRLLRRPHRS